ncbi:acetyl-CoA acetyltransferase [Sphingobium jiangsuense]|nr:acetyl-CoA acetyltransferase [Sphingobium jiangsuense]
MAEVRQAYLFDAIRVPRGKGRDTGALHGVPPVALLSGLFREMAARHPQTPAAVDGAVIGCVTQTGDQGGNIGQAAMLSAGWDGSGSATMVNSFCTSGLTATATGAARVRLGEADLMAVGGVESMSRVPMMSDKGPLAGDPAIARAIPFIPNPIIADYVATVEGFTRDDISAYAARSHRKADAATRNGHFVRSLIPVTDAEGSVLLDRDEAVRGDSTPEGMARLEPLFDEARAAWGDAELIRRFGGTDKVAHIHHAAAAPAIVDGASLALVGSREGGERAGLKPRARLLACSSANSPAAMGLGGGAVAARDALARAGMTADDIDLWEFNEGFAAIAMAFARQLKVPEDRLNVNGGGIAMGHAMGATGVNLIGILLDELERRDLNTGLIAISGATGIGGALIVERAV